MNFRVSSTIALLLTVGAAQVGTGIPEQFWSRNPHRTSPLWISARAALDGQALRPGVMADHERAALRKHLDGAGARRKQAGAGDPCEVTFGPLLDDAPMPASRTLDDVRRHAAAHRFSEGTVIGSEVGFYAGTPFTVVEVRVTRSSKPGGPRTAYLLLPKGTVSVDGVTVCTSDPRYGELPVAGDRVLFVAGPSVDDGGTLFRLPAEHIFVSHGGTVVVPRRLRAEIQDPTLSQLRELLERPTRAAR